MKLHTKTLGLVTSRYRQYGCTKMLPGQLITFKSSWNNHEKEAVITKVWNCNQPAANVKLQHRHRHTHAHTHTITKVWNYNPYARKATSSQQPISTKLPINCTSNQPATEFNKLPINSTSNQPASNLYTKMHTIYKQTTGDKIEASINNTNHHHSVTLIQKRT